MTILAPHTVLDTAYAQLNQLNQALHAINCSIGITGFKPSKHSIKQALSLQSKYIVFSAQWVESINKNDKSFSTLTKYLEDQGVNVILP